MKEWLCFRRMITPGCVQLIFWLGSVIFVIGGVRRMLWGPTVCLPFFGMLAGILILRLFCERLIILFRVHEGLSLRDGR